MTSSRLLLVVGLVILLILGAGIGAWKYLFGANEVEAAQLVPGNTVLFATIPNAAAILAGYETSKLKTLVESPNSKPLHDAIVDSIGQKNLDLIQAFLPNLSGQSFIAVTHLDYDHPEKIGLIAGMKPKAGMGDFDAFLEKLKATWPDVVKQGKTGTSSVEGVNYDWIQGPGAPDKICVARVSGWIVTTWGEASLQDWIERFQKKSTTSSLADDLDYRKSLAEVGDNPMTLVYVNNRALVEVLQKQMAKTDPTAGGYLGTRLAALGGAAVATRFENGEISDRFSLLIPRPVQLDAGMGSDACQFDTLKFTGPDTCFYWAGNVNWEQIYKKLKEHKGPSSYEHDTIYPMASYVLPFLQAWMHDTTLDTQQNILGALGSEVSVQAEWSADATYPEVGLFVKLDKPDDFKPTVAAIVESVRKAYASSAVIKEMNSNGQNFASLQFVQSSALSPTITEDGPYLGVFMTANQAVRSFQRDPTIGLTHRADFNRQVDDKRTGAAQLIFLDTPHLLDRGYQTALPYLSLAQMANIKGLSPLLKGRQLPPDLSWLAPMGTWSCVITSDEDGIDAYSISGIGNQGILVAGALAGAVSTAQNMGFLPKPNPAREIPFVSPNQTPPISLGTPPPQAPMPSTNAPDMNTNSAPMPVSPTGTNSAPSDSNSNATPLTPGPPQPQ